MQAFDEGPWPRMSGKERAKAMMNLVQLLEVSRLGVLSVHVLHCFGADGARVWYGCLSLPLRVLPVIYGVPRVAGVILKGGFTTCSMWAVCSNMRRTCV